MIGVSLDRSELKISRHRPLVVDRMVDSFGMCVGVDDGNSEG